jgi:hypothetical protein
VDVWDFNPEENVTEKIKKINEVKDGRGLRKFIKAGAIVHHIIITIGTIIPQSYCPAKCNRG